MHRIGAGGGVELDALRYLTCRRGIRRNRTDAMKQHTNAGELQNGKPRADPAAGNRICQKLFPLQ